ncbi:hypothetical protein [Euzebya sp.]|uniref:hypothetical protein n=1 Tax=Euzebya sp. TaxID=1971409 RepID=UPI0035129339
MSTSSEPIATRTRWPQAGRGQKWLLGGSALILVGSFLPWITLSGIATVNGIQTAGLWTFYLGFLGLAGALVPSRTAATVQGIIAGGAAVVLPAWQVLRVSGLGVEGWQPGLGIFVCAAGASLAIRGVVHLVGDA